MSEFIRITYQKVGSGGLGYSPSPNFEVSSPLQLAGTEVYFKPVPPVAPLYLYRFCGSLVLTPNRTTLRSRRSPEALNNLVAALKDKLLLENDIG